jgi:hypothetical protein
MRGGLTILRIVRHHPTTRFSSAFGICQISSAHPRAAPIGVLNIPLPTPN